MSVASQDIVFSTLVRWVNAITGLKVIRAYPGATESFASPYLMLNLLSARSLHAHEQDVEYVETDVVDDETGFKLIEAQPVIEMEWMFSLNCYGENSMDILRPIVGASKLQQILEPMYPELILHRVSDRRHLPEFINAEWQDRSQIDLFMRGIVQDGFVVDVIDAIETTIVQRMEG